MGLLKTGVVATMLAGAAALAFSQQTHLSSATKSLTATTPPNGIDDGDLPATAPLADRAMMVSWETANDTCQGTNVAPDSQPCKTRDALLSNLEERGWCWNYEDWTVVRADNRWHRCSEKTLPRNKRSVQIEEQVEDDALKPSSTPLASVPSADQTDNPAARPIRDRRQQQIDDARAMVRESWNVYGPSIQALELGYDCGVIEKFDAGFAISKVQSMMQDELASAGLLGDPRMNIATFTDRYVKAGKASAQHGACSRLSAADRGRLRSEVWAVTR